MKFMMNGALTIGTRDGATIEMAEGQLFQFGLTAEQVVNSCGWYNPRWHYQNEPETRGALDLIFSDYFSRKTAILNIASSGKFSRDRTIAEYASEIWKAEPVAIQCG